MKHSKAATIIVLVLLGLIYLGRTSGAQVPRRAHITVVGGRLVAGGAPDLNGDYEVPQGEVKGFSCITVNVKDFNGTVVTGVPQCYILSQ